MLNSISVAVVFLHPFEPRRHFLSIGYRSSSSSSSSMSPQFRNCLSNSSLDPCGVLSLFFHLHPRYLFCFSVSFPTQPGFVSASPFILISAFVSSLSMSGRRCSPTHFFVPSSLGLFYCRSPLHSFYPSPSIESRLPLCCAERWLW